MKTTWTTKDGQEWEDEKDAKAHEDKLFEDWIIKHPEFKKMFGALPIKAVPIFTTYQSAFREMLRMVWDREESEDHEDHEEIKKSSNYPLEGTIPEWMPPANIKHVENQ